jgi:hypothetical protein
VAKVKNFSMFLAQMIFDFGKTDKEILDMYKDHFNIDEMDSLKKNLKFIRANREAVYPEPKPMCPDCLVPLNHKSIEEGCLEVMYCPICLKEVYEETL